MATGSEIVKRGAEGTGAAQVFQSNATDPISSYVAGRQLNQPDPEQEKAARKQRDEQWDEFWDWQPEKIWERFDDYGKEYLDNYREFTRQLELSGVDPTNPNVRKIMLDKQSEVDNNFKKTFAIKEVYNEAETFARSEEAKSRYKDNTLIPQLRDRLWSKDGQSITPPSDVNIVKDWKAIQSDVENYDMNKTWKIIMDGFGEKVSKMYDNLNTKNGDIIRETESIKGKIWEYEKDSQDNTVMEYNAQTGEYTPKILMESDGLTPVVRVTDDTYPVFMSDDYMKNYLESKNPYDQEKEGQKHKKWNMNELSSMAKARVGYDYSKTATGAGKDKSIKPGYDGFGNLLPKTKSYFDIIQKTVNMDDDVVGAWQSVFKGTNLRYQKGDIDQQTKASMNQVLQNPDISQKDKEGVKDIMERSGNGIMIERSTGKYEWVDLIPEYYKLEDGSEGAKFKTKDNEVVAAFIPIKDNQDSKRSAERQLLTLGIDMGMIDEKDYDQSTQQSIYDDIDNNASADDVYDTDEEDDSGGVY